MFVRDEDVECDAADREEESAEAGRVAEKDADAAADVKEESADGSVASGVMVVSIVSQVSSGLKLRARSPRPSIGGAGLHDSRRPLETNAALPARVAVSTGGELDRAGGSAERLVIRRKGGKSVVSPVTASDMASTGRSGPALAAPVARTAPAGAGGWEDRSIPCLRWV